MKRLLIGLMAVLALMPMLLSGSAVPQGATPAPPRPETDVAVLTGVRGAVEVRRAGAEGFTPASCTTLLAPGDVVRAGKDGSAVLLYADGSRAALDGDHLVTLAPAESAATSAFAALRRALRGVLDSGGAALDRGGYLERGFQQ